jgi:hypothetical protein
MQTANRSLTIGGSGTAASTIRKAQYVAVAGIAFQIVHLVEHVAQTGYWFMHPADAPWLTPWAVVGRDMLVVGGRIVTGNELLHLLGNGIFMGALLALAWVAKSHGMSADRFPHLGKAIATQGIHLAEHVLLTLTVFTIGMPLGLSTLFGFATGSWGSSYRIWFHFIINAIATYYATMGVAEMHQDDLIVPGARRSPTAQVGV